MVESQSGSYSFLIEANDLGHIQRLNYPDTSAGWQTINVAVQTKWPRMFTNSPCSSMFYFGNAFKQLTRYDREVDMFVDVGVQDAGNDLYLFMMVAILPSAAFLSCLHL